MKFKASVIFAILMATAVFSTQNQAAAKQTTAPQIVQSTQQNTKNANMRAIGSSKTNWSKIKDMFM